MDGSGRIYVPDSGNGNVQIFDSSRTYVATISDPVTVPYGVDVDGSGNIYVADAGRNRITVFNSTLQHVADIDRSLDQPTGVVINASSGHMYVTEYGDHHVSVFRPAYSFDVEDPANLRTLNVSLPAGRVQDLVGGANEASGPAGIRIDRAAPVPVITAVQSSPTNSTVINFNVTFSKPVTGFGPDDIALSGTPAPDGGVASVAGGPANYTFDVVPAADGGTAGQHRRRRGPGRGRQQQHGGGPVPDNVLELAALPPDPRRHHGRSGVTNLQTVPFNLTFNKPINEETLAAPDIDATSGTVSNLRPVWHHDGSFGGRGPGDGQLTRPIGVDVDSSGRIYVGDGGNRRVAIFDPGWGHVAHIDGRFGGSIDVAVDGSSGNIYVADTFGNRVEAFGPSLDSIGNITDSLARPNGVAVDDSTGNIYVSDRDNDRIRVYGPDLIRIADIENSFGVPNGVDVDASGRIYVPDSGNGNVQIFDSSRTYVATISDPVTVPYGVDVDGSGNIYVADAGRNRITVFDSALRHVADIDRSLDQPTGVVINASSGHMYVTEYGDHHVGVFRPAYSFDVEDPANLRTLNVSLPAGRVQDLVGGANEASDPAGIRIDRDAPVPRITAVQSSPTNSTVINFNVTFSKPVTGFGPDDIALSGTPAPDGGVASVAGGPANYTFDVVPAADGVLLVNIGPGAARDEAGNNSTAAARFLITYWSSPPSPLIPDVTTVRSGTTDLQTVPFNLTFNKPINEETLETSDIDATSGTVSNLRPVWHHDGSFGDRGPGDGQLTRPIGADLDSSGRIYVGDGGNRRVAIFDPGWGHVAHIDGRFGGSIDVAVDGSSGNIYVADTFGNRVEAFGPSLDSIGNITDSLARPNGVAVDDSTGNIYVSDRDNDRIRVYGPDLIRIADIENSFGVPNGVDVDGSGRIYVPDSGNGNVQIFDSSRTYVATISDPVTVPYGVDVDGSGNIYVADAGRNRVAVFDSALRHVADIDRSLDQPTGVVINASSGHMYVTEYGDHHVSVFRPAYAFDVEDPADLRTLNVSLPAGRVQDLVGGANEASGPAGIRIDRAVPVPRITAVQSSPTNSTVINFEVRFTENVTGFELSDIDLAGSASTVAATNFGGSDGYSDYAFDVIPTGTGNVTVNIDAGAANHLTNGRPSTAADRFLIKYDLDAPGVSVSSVPAGPIIVTSPIVFTARFTENVTGFVSSEIVLSGITTTGGVTNFVGPDGYADYTFEVVPAVDGTLDVDIAAGAARDEAANPSTAAPGFSIIYASSLSSSTLASAAVTGPNQVTVHYGGSVDAGTRAYGTLRIDGIPRTYAADPLSGNGTDTHVLAFTGAATGTGATGTVSVNLTDVTIPSLGIAIGTQQAFRQQLTDGQPPGIVSAAITAPNRFTVWYTEPVHVTSTAAAAYGAPTVDGSTRGYPATDPLSGDGTAAHLLAFDGAAAAHAATGTLTIDQTAVADAAGNALGTDTAAPQTLEGDGQLRVLLTTGAPALTGLDPVPFELDFSRPVNATTLNGTADISLTSGAVSKFRPVLTPAGQTGGQGVFNQPHGIDVDPGTGRIYMADAFNHRVVVLDAARTQIGTITGLGFPWDVAVNGTGHLFVAEADRNRARVSVYDGNMDHVGDIGIRARGVEVSGNGTVYVSEYNAHRVMLYNTTLDYTGRNITGGGLDVPAGIAVDDAVTGNIYVASRNSDSVRVYDPGLNHIGEIHLGTNSRPNGVETDGMGNIYVNDKSLDAHRIHIYDSGREHLAAVHSSFVAPYDIAVDPAGARVYVTEAGNTARIQAFNVSYAFEVAGAADQATLGVSLPADRVLDPAGNENAASDTVELVIDRRIPLPVITSEQHPGPTNAAAIGFSVTFGQPVTGFTASDITLTGDTASGGVANFDNSSAPVYRFDVVPSEDGDFTVDVAAGAARSLGGIDNAAATQFQIRSDRTAPAPVITGEQTLSHGVPTLNLTVAWGENVTGFDAADVVLSGITATGGVLNLQVVRDTGGANYTFGAVPAEDGTLHVDIAAGTVQDLAGNGNGAADRFSIGYDSSVPAAAITSVQSSPTNATPIVFNVTFSREVAGFAAEDVTLAGDPVPSGGLDNFERINATDYSFEVAPTRDGTITVRVAAGVAQSTANGLDSTAAAPLAIRYDGSAPAPRITGEQTGPGGVPTLNFTVDWGENVTGFDTADVVLSGLTTTGGGVLNLQVVHGTGGANYTFGVIPAEGGTLHVDIAAGAAADIAGNGNEAAPRFSISYDAPRPTTTVTSVQASPTNSTVINFNVTFSDTVTGFAAADVTLTGGAVRAAPWPILR